MSTCTLRVGDRSACFGVPPGETLLDAAAAAGWELPHSCRRGTCETCRARVVEGVVSPAADADGTALLCCTTAHGDVTVEPLRMERHVSTPRRRLRARVYRVAWPDTDVAVIDLRFPTGVRVPFLAGQYLQVQLEGHAPRAFSMANAPSANDGVQLHVRALPGGVFGAGVLPGLQRGDELELELPFGDFHLRDAPGRPVLLLAGGTGFSPIQSLLEDSLPRHLDRRFHLYWGARHAAGLYAPATLERWQRRHRNFDLTCVLSESAAVPPQRAGLVHEAVMADHADLSGHDVYVCGSPGLVQAARSNFVAHRGLPPERFFSDSFVTPGEASAPIRSGHDRAHTGRTDAAR